MDSTGLIVQTGGRMLGQGAYGCIFTPPLRCLNRRKETGKKGKLGKLTQKGDIKNEIAAAKHFQPYLRDARKYFILPEMDTLCKPAEERKQVETDLPKCEALQRYGWRDMLHYEIEYGGKTLHEKLEAMNNLNEFPYWAFVGQMLEIGAYLALHGVIHNDMHSNNIMLNVNFFPRLIDFGRCYMANAITEEVIDELSAKFAPGLGQISPESSAQDGITSGMKLGQIYEDIRREKPGIENVEKILGISRDTQMAEFKKFWESSRALQAQDWLSFWKLYWPTVDAWAIGHDLMSILKRLRNNREFMASKEWSARGGQLKTILRGLLRTSARERLDCVEALAMWDPANALLATPSGKAWLDKKAAQRQRQRGGGAAAATPAA